MSSNRYPQQARILVAVLDWGLGHATRCMPIITALRDRGTAVVLAGSGPALALLRKEFPDLPAERLPAYAIRYDTENMYFNMARQGPKILRTIFREHRVLDQLVKKHRLDAVISDSRFGCFSRRIPCVFVSHQLTIRIGNAMAGQLVNQVNRALIGRHTECWVPDFAGEANLSGLLSHPSPLPHVQYIGPLSRLEPTRGSEKNDLLVLLSGPEPQRSYLEEKLIEQLRPRKEQVLLIQGKTECAVEEWLRPGFRKISHAVSREIAGYLAGADLVVCRSGYSTLLDLARLGKKALLIPTPGQTEQEYLAEYMQAKGWATMQRQATLDLSRGIRQAMACRGFPMLIADHLSPVIDNFLKKIRSG